MKKEFLEYLSKHIITFDLDEESKKNIVKVDNPPYPGSIVCPNSPLDWYAAFEDHHNELTSLTRVHNKDEEKSKETIKCVVRMPVIASFTNNGDKNTWVVKLEMNPKRMLELYHRRHEPDEEEG